MNFCYFDLSKTFDTSKSIFFFNEKLLWYHFYLTNLMTNQSNQNFIVFMDRGLYNFLNFKLIKIKEFARLIIITYISVTFITENYMFLLHYKNMRK